MNNLSDFSKNIEFLQKNYDDKNLHNYEWKDGVIEEKKGFRKLTAKLGYVWSWITGKAEKKELELYQKLFQSCTAKFTADLKANSPSLKGYVSRIPTEIADKVVSVYHSVIINKVGNQATLEQLFKQRVRELESFKVGEFLLQGGSLHPTLAQFKKAFESDVVLKSLLQQGIKVKDAVREFMVDQNFDDDFIGNLLVARGAQLHEAFQAEHGDVEIENGEPLPSKDQLKAVFDLVKSDPIFGPLLNKYAENDSISLKLAKELQFIMVGDKIDQVKKPENLCFTFAEAKEKDRTILLTLPEQCTSFLDWHLKSFLRTTIDDEKVKYLGEFDRDVNRTDYEINGISYKQPGIEKFDEIVKGMGCDEIEIERLKLVASQAGFAVDSTKFNNGKPNLIARVDGLDLVASGKKKKIVILGKNEIQFSSRYDMINFSPASKTRIFFQMDQLFHIREIEGENRVCGEMIQSDLRVSPFFDFDTYDTF